MCFYLHPHSDVSIHPILLLIQNRCIKRFQKLQVSIHPILLLIPLTMQWIRDFPSFNTSYITINPSSILAISSYFAVSIHPILLLITQVERRYKNGKRVSIHPILLLIVVLLVFHLPFSRFNTSYITINPTNIQHSSFPLYPNSPIKSRIFLFFPSRHRILQNLIQIPYFR